MPDTPKRTVFYVSDGTGITAETLGHSLLAQFPEFDYDEVRAPFIDAPEKASDLVERIERVKRRTGLRPIVFSTLVQPAVVAVLHRAEAHIVDLFGTFLGPLERELGMPSTHAVGRFHGILDNRSYQRRIEAINFALSHDDGIIQDGTLDDANIILIGVSRSGKTPTSLYLAMQHGLKVANYPLIPEDFERRQLPPALVPHRKKIFGLTIDPQRLSQIRNERRPGSKYADLANCRYEVSEAEAMMRRSGIRWLSSITKSIEEIATTILQEVRPERLAY